MYMLLRHYVHSALNPVLSFMNKQKINKYLCGLFLSFCHFSKSNSGYKVTVIWRKHCVF
jgi:hypothetical protein